MTVALGAAVNGLSWYVFIVEAVSLFSFPPHSNVLFSILHACNGSGCHAGCSATFARAAIAPASAVAELGVVVLASLYPMPHSYEELRTAAFDVLARRVRVAYDPSQYRHLTIGVATALLERDAPIKQQHHSVSPRDASLESEDANTFLEVFWDLFRQGIITLGLDDSNPEFPWFHLTALGERVVAGEDAYFVHDVSGYEKRIVKEIPKIDPVTLLYLKEALQTFRSGCVLSATVMLGVATEHTFLLLMEAIDRSTTHQTTFASVSKERTILQKVNKFRHILEQQTKALPSEVKEDLDTNFSGILSIIRNFRNQSGHPSGKIIDREQAYILLQLFPPYCKKMHQLMDFYA